MEKRIPLLPGEQWFGGAIEHGELMPFHPGYRHDLEAFTNNQAAPLLISTCGRWVWSGQSFAFRFNANALVIERGAEQVTTGRADSAPNLRGAYLETCQRFFPPAGKIPDEMLFTHPQYNTWIELMYDQAQEPILRYAEALLRAGYPPGVLMIDDTWQTDYGVWTFNAQRFNDPRALIDRLHALGFKVMLWVVPYVSPDSVEYRELARAGLLVRDAEERVAVREWWNGWSAVLDLGNAATVAWFRAKLDHLQSAYGVDGFKFDGGDPTMYRSTDRVAGSADPMEQCEAYARFGLNYSLNEYRACWKLGAQPLAQRLRDRFNAWDERGVGSCISASLAQGLIGHAFVCPDMIGGGDFRSFLPGSDELDGELFVRHAQLSALMPMMQYSAAPWRVLPEREQQLCLAAAQLHVRMGDEILQLARNAARTGEPMLRHSAYQEGITAEPGMENQFLLGEDILVAPVIEKGARDRRAYFPRGVWESEFAGEAIQGGAWHTVPAPLERLPWWRRRK